MSLLSQQVACSPALGRTCRRVQPFKAGRSLSVRVRAEDATTATPAVASTSKPVILSWEKDTETIRDVFAFAGSAPERVNGRVAMIGFVSILGPELSKKQAVLDQIGDSWFLILAFTTTLTLASILPKIISGVSLKELHASATSANLQGEGAQQALALFDQSYELWSGRLAMLGFAGLIAIEAIKGESFF